MTTLLEVHLKSRVKDLNELLSYSRQTIIDCTERSEDEREQAEQTLTTIRCFLSHYERDNPVHSTEIQQCWVEVLQSLIPNEAQKHLRIDTATEAQTRLARYEARFQKAWGLPSCEILQSKHNPASGFNTKTMQSLVQFAERSSCENGQAALEEALRLRLQSDDDRPYRTREPYVVPSDVKKAQELYNSNHYGEIENEYVTTRRKRKRVAEEDRAFFVKYQAKSVLNTSGSTGDGMDAETGAEYAGGRDVELQREGTQAPPYGFDRVCSLHEGPDKTAQIPPSYGNDRVRHCAQESSKDAQASPNGANRVRYCSEESNIGTQTPPSYGDNRVHHRSEEGDEGTQATPSGSDRVRYCSGESNKGTPATPNGVDRARYCSEESDKGTQTPPDADNKVRHHSTDSDKGPQATPNCGNRVRYLPTVSNFMHD